MSGPFKMKGMSFGNLGIEEEVDNTMGVDKPGKNTALIEALTKQDKAEADINKIKESTDDASSMNTVLNK